MTPEFAFVALLAGMGLFTVAWLVLYEWRAKSQEASTPERVLAGAWLVVRRLVLFFVGLVFLLATLYAAFTATWSAASWKQELGGIAVGLLLSLVAFWVGIYGAGRRRFFSDDRKVHNERKERYGWRW